MTGSKIKDTDYLYASARVKSLERGLLSRERLERMSEAKTIEDALKLLSETGWPEIAAPGMAGVEDALSGRREEAFTLIRSLAPDKRLPDVFLIKYDYHNLKTLLKSEATGENPDPLLIGAGRLPCPELKAALREEDFSGLGQIMAQSAAEARDVLARTQDPQLLDLILDRAMHEEMLEMAASLGSDYLLGYVRLLIDSVNLRVAVRLRRMGKGAEILRYAAIGGGTVSITRLLGDLSPDVIESVFNTSALAPAAQAGVAALRGESGLAAMDLACDDILLRYLKKAKYVAFGAEPLIGYLGAVEAELTAVRTVMAGRLAELSPEMITERLRETYV
ncbi:MAG: V-type ATPase subunit [Peptococcaceae bacterium]|nr:V-type ATPase subunit [Peptococcaceae bacterium]